MDRKTALALGIGLTLIASWIVGNLLQILPSVIEVESGGLSVGQEEAKWWLLGLAIALVILAAVFFPKDKDFSKIYLITMGLFGYWWLTAYLMVRHGLIFITAMIIISIAGILFTKRRKYWAKIVFGSAAIILIIGLPIMYAFFNAEIKIGLSPEEGELINPSEFTRSNGGGMVMGSQGFLVIILIVIFIAAVILFSKFKSGLISETKEEKEQKTERVERVVDDTIQRLIQGKDVRSSVMRCYQKMCLLMEDKGLSLDDSTTPREFEKNCQQYFNISSSSISELTELFEEARYSSHELEEGYRERALEDLRRVRDEMVG